MAGDRDSDRDVWEELSFLAAPDRVVDWRMVLLYEVAAEAGMLAELPATADQLAQARGLDADAVRVVLEALAVWGVVAVDGERFTPGPRLPDPEGAAVLRHHSRSMRRWCERLPAATGAGGGDFTGGSAVGRWGLELWMDALAVNARRSAPAAVGECVRRAPGARTVLDLGGGHGEYALEFARRGLRVTMLDKPEVVDLGRRRGRLEEVGVSLYAGDFFQDPLPGPFDVVFCAGVSYTLDGARNRELFGRVAGALAPGGTLAVHTFLRGQDPRAAIFAVQMAGVAGGDTHAEAEYRAWLADTGYRSVDVVRLPRPPESLVLATR